MTRLYHVFCVLYSGGFSGLSFPIVLSLLGLLLPSGAHLLSRRLHRKLDSARCQQEIGDSVVGIARLALEPKGQSVRWFYGGAFVWKGSKPEVLGKVVVSCVAVLVLTSCGKLSTWHRFCVLRPPVPKCPPAQLTESISRFAQTVKTTEWFTCMERSCPMSGVFWCGAVGTAVGPPAQGGIQILGGVLLIQEQIGEMVLTVAVCWRWD